MQPRVLLAMRPDLTPDLMGPAQWQRLDDVAEVLDRSPIESFSTPDARARLARTDVLLAGWGCPRLDEAVLGAAPHLRLVAHTGSSVKPIVSEALWCRGIQVISAAAANAVAVAEFALAAILLANKRAFAVREDYRTRRAPPRCPWVAPGDAGNLGAVVGIVGASRTGRHLLYLLRAFDLCALVYDPIARPADIEELGARAVSLEELIDTSDVVSLHAPSLPETRRMIDARMLARMRDGATLINTARGDLIDHDALERELVVGRLAAVLDVTDPEPLPRQSRLLDLPNVFITPHIAGAAGRETQRLADLAIAEIARFAAGQPLRHRITPDTLATIG